MYPPPHDCILLFISISHSATGPTGTAWAARKRKGDGEEKGRRVRECVCEREEFIDNSAPS
jgi:hypothetical protein